MAEYHLAQLDVALRVELLTSAWPATSVGLLDPVNATTDAAPGFVRRLQAEDRRDRLRASGQRPDDGCFVDV